MKFYMPVRVYDEDDCVKNHADDIAALGKCALIVTGKNSAKENGSLDDVTTVLKQKDIEYQIFCDVEENPSTDTVLSAGRQFAGKSIDMVIGIGGGSPMDAAKAISLVLKHPEADLEYLYDTSKSPDSLPVICVPTTCGTGSEVTGVSVLTRHDKNTKISMVHKVFPKLALIDGKYLGSAPVSLIANSSIDALSHLLESSLNSKADDYVRMTASAGLKLWSETKDILQGKRKAGREDYSKLMRSSTLAGMSIAQSGTSVPHALSYNITYDLSMPHGMAVGYFLPGFMAAAPQKERGELLRLAGFTDVGDFSSFVRGTLQITDVPADELQRTFETVKNNPSKMKSASFPVDDEILRKIVWFG